MPKASLPETRLLAKAIVDEIRRLRPHYQSRTATDAGRRQMLDYLEEFIKKQVTVKD